MVRKRFENNIGYNKDLRDTSVWIDVLVGEIEDPKASTGVGMNLGSVIAELQAEEAKSQLSSEVWLVNSAGTIYLISSPKTSRKPLRLSLPELAARAILYALEEVVLC